MKGTITIPVGRYELVDGLVFTIRASDAGAVVSISDPETDRRLTAVIDEFGRVIAKSGQAEGVSPAALLAAVLRTGPRLVANPPSHAEKSGRKVPVPKRVKLVLADAKPKERPTNHAHVFTGFTDGRVVHVLYRIVLGETMCPFDQFLLDGKKIILASQIPKEDRLTPTRYRQVSYLPEQDTFNLGKSTFRKMSLAELRPLLKGRTIRVAPPKSG